MFHSAEVQGQTRVEGDPGGGNDGEEEPADNENQEEDQVFCKVQSDFLPIVASPCIVVFSRISKSDGEWGV